MDMSGSGSFFRALSILRAQGVFLDRFSYRLVCFARAKQ